MWYFFWIGNCLIKSKKKEKRFQLYICFASAALEDFAKSLKQKICRVLLHCSKAPYYIILKCCSVLRKCFQLSPNVISAFCINSQPQLIQCLPVWQDEVMVWLISSLCLETGLSSCLWIGRQWREKQAPIKYFMLQNKSVGNKKSTSLRLNWNSSGSGGWGEDRHYLQEEANFTPPPSCCRLLFLLLRLERVLHSFPAPPCEPGTNFRLHSVLLEKQEAASDGTCELLAQPAKLSVQHSHYKN